MREDGVTCGRITRSVGGCCEVREENERCWSMVRGAGYLCEVRKDDVSCLRMVEGAVMVMLGEVGGLRGCGGVCGMALGECACG